MAALDFPDTPAVGDLFGSSGTVWRWDGARWASTAGASGARGIVAYAESTGNLTLGTTHIDMGTPITFNAVAGRRYLLTGAFSASGGTGDVVMLTIQTSGGTQLCQHGWVTTAGLVFPRGQTSYVFNATTTGPVSFKMTGGTMTGGSTAIGQAGSPRFLMAEDITYEAGSSGGSGPSGWTNMALTSNFSGNGSAYRSVGDRIELKGLIQFSVSLAVGSSLAAGTLPAPSANRMLGCLGWGGGAGGGNRIARVDVSSAGAMSVVCDAGTPQGWVGGNWISLDGLSYPI